MIELFQNSFLIFTFIILNIIFVLWINFISIHHNFNKINNPLIITKFTSLIYIMKHHKNNWSQSYTCDNTEKYCYASWYPHTGQYVILKYPIQKHTYHNYQSTDYDSMITHFDDFRCNYESIYMYKYFFLISCKYK